ncbi:hypothetical protein DFR28_103334 [Arenicella xantha]|uniref:Uncharacterized protein n=1 Tax=Arenicella xantha TaxID=644221 RepID=A0A395JLL4_9GAMM|nr:hypothetical protein DFR28_103334 [Arenicella xantha]
MPVKTTLVMSCLVPFVLYSATASAAEYQLRLESKEALNGYISVKIFRKRVSCIRAKSEHEAANPGRKLSCHKLKKR